MKKIPAATMCALLASLSVWTISQAAPNIVSSQNATDAHQIIRSPADAKAYRALTLDNGLKVMLVSDPDADQAAASLDVYVGSGSDPARWQGLAHFLEHMLFLGTEKYPQAGEYKAFMDKHGGSNNAYTSFDHTNYYFNIGADHLLPALDRFSRFFIDPTFDATYVKRERAVVHSEYQARRKDEGRRLWAAQRQLLHPAHPAARFAVGTQYTLRDRDGVSVRQKLIEFYQRHYSADIMTLAVVGRESLDQLERAVIQRFRDVPKRNAKPQRFEQPYLNPKLFGSRFDVVPQKDALGVSFLFPVPSVRGYYRSKPLRYVGNLLGHEGEGSLLALLKALGWAEGLSAGANYMDAVQGSFEVSVRLTEQGVRQIDAIGALLFQYIGLITASGVEAWRYEEEQKLADISFRFAEEHGVGAVARVLAAWLHRYPTADVLRGAYMMNDYRPVEIRRLLSRLTPNRVIVQVVSKGADTSDQTPFYDVAFGIQRIPQATMERWKHARKNRAEWDARLALPRPSRFIPQRLTTQTLNDAVAIPQRLNLSSGALIPSEIHLSRAFFAEKLGVTDDAELTEEELKARRLEEHAQDPDVYRDGEIEAVAPDTPFVSALDDASPVASDSPPPVKSKPGIDAWYHGDPQFGTPRAAFYFSVQSPIASGRWEQRAAPVASSEGQPRPARDSARNLVLTELFVRMVNEQLDATVYPARLAGLRHHLYRHSRGFSVRITGYEDKQPELLDAVLDALFVPKFTAAKLALVQAKLKREWNNVALESPSRQGGTELYRMLLHPYWSEAERIAALDTIDLDDLTAHATDLFKTAAVTTLSHGDVTLPRAVALNRKLQKAFASTKWIPRLEPPMVRILESNEVFLRTLDVDHEDSALITFFQGHEKSELERAKMTLLVQLMESPFFFNLRTTHRVGYLVHVAELDMLEVPGLLLSVQSPTHTPIQIAWRVAQFLDSFRQTLEEMSEDDFAQIKRGLRERILVRDQKLDDRTNRYWHEIDRGKFGFNSRQRLSWQIDSLDQWTIGEFYEDLVRRQARKLMVQIPGRRPHAEGQHLEGERYADIHSPKEFRKNAQAFFPPQR